MQRLKMLAWGIWYSVRTITLDRVAALLLFGCLIISIALFGGIDLNG